MTPIAREQAIQQGLQHYFTGRPCPRGHIAPRFVSSFGCKECSAENAVKKRSLLTQEEREEIRERSKQDKRRRAEEKRKSKEPFEVERLRSIRELMASLGFDYPLTRASAKEVGSIYYFNGTTCARGHVDRRFSDSGGCYTCQKENSKKNRQKPEQRPKVLERKRRDYFKRKDKIKEAVKKYVEKNREEINRKKREYQKKNPHIHRAIGSFRRARLRKATPPWITPQMREDIKSLHAQAELLELETGIQFDVDHIVQLDGKTVCGLHVPWNLRLLKHSDNISRPKHFVDHHLGRCEDSINYTLVQTAQQTFWETERGFPQKENLDG